MAAVVVCVDVAVVVVVGVVVSVVVVAVVVGEVVGVVTSQSPALLNPRGFSRYAATMLLAYDAKETHSSSVFPNLKENSSLHSSDASKLTAGPANSVTAASKAAAVVTQPSAWYTESFKLPKMVLDASQPMLPKYAVGQRFMIS